MTNLRRLFDQAVRASDHRKWVRGRLGRPNGDGTYTVITDRPGFFYVRVSQSGSESVTVARALGKVPARAGLPVRMVLEIGGTYTIDGVDPAHYEAATADDEPNAYGVPYHTHRLDSGLTYEIEPERFEPGRVYPDADLVVYINPFRYHWNEEWKYWPGGRIDLASVQPSTSTKWAWVLAGVNPETNEAVAVAGDEYASQAELTLDLLNDIAFAYYIPCGAVQVAEADSALSDFSRYYDAHAWYTSHSDFNDDDGTPANVVTDGALPGNSPFPARADHLHGISDESVTNAKLTQMDEGTLKGRKGATGTGAPIDITLVDGPEVTWVWSDPPDELTLTLQDESVTNAKLADMDEATIKGRKGATGAGVPVDITLVDGPEVAWVWSDPPDELTLSLLDGAIGLDKLGDIPTDRLLGRDTASSGAIEELTVGGGLEFTGSGGIQRAALTGDVTAAAGNNTTTIANDVVTNVKLANMAEATLKGRAAGAGTGDPADLSAAQVRAILGLTAGGTLHVSTTQAGNVGTGEDTLASYTVPAGQLANNGDTLWFEAFGTMAANGNAKTVRVRFGAAGTNLLYEQTNTGWGEHWSVRGRLYRTGSSAQKASVDLISDNDDRVSTQTTTGVNQDLTGTVALAVTAEAVADNDVVIEGLIVGWQPTP